MPVASLDDVKRAAGDAAVLTLLFDAAEPAATAPRSAIMAEAKVKAAFSELGIDPLAVLDSHLHSTDAPMDGPGQPADGDLTWFLDEAAAGRLDAV